MNDLTKFLLIFAAAVVHSWFIAWYMERRIIKLISGIRVSFDKPKEEAPDDPDEEVPAGAHEFIPPQPGAPVFTVTQIRERPTVAEEEAEESEQFSDYEGKL